MSTQRNRRSKLKRVDHPDLIPLLKRLAENLEANDDEEPFRNCYTILRELSHLENGKMRIRPFVYDIVAEYALVFHNLLMFDSNGEVLLNCSRVHSLRFEGEELASGQDARNRAMAACFSWLNAIDSEDKRPAAEPPVPSHTDAEQTTLNIERGPVCPQTEVTPTAPSFSESPIDAAFGSKNGFLGGEELARALDIHPTREAAFFRQLGRKRTKLGDDSWRDVNNARSNTPQFLYRVDSESLLNLAAKYKAPKMG